jgi:hypothetical protein
VRFALENILNLGVKGGDPQPCSQTSEISVRAYYEWAQQARVFVPARPF